MSKKARIFIQMAWILMLLTAGMHSLSFFNEPKAANATEAQLIELMNNYKSDMGAGYHRSMQELFTSISACLTLLCLLGGLIVFYVSRNVVEIKVLKGILLIHALVFGIAFLVMVFFAFLPPIVCMGLIFTSCGIAAYFLK